MKSLAGASLAGTVMGCGQPSGAARLSLNTADAAEAERPSVFTSSLGAVTLAQIPIGGGGFVTGIDVSVDGELFVCRTDVTNGYVRRAADKAWQPLFSPQTMRVEDYDPLPPGNDKADGLGVSGVRIAPSNKDIIYATFCGYVWKSLDGGRTIRRTRFNQAKLLAGAGRQRVYNRTIDIDPQDPNKLIVGTWGEGAWVSDDGGDNWRRLLLPEAGKSLDDHPGIHLVLFNPKDPESLFVFVTGVGLFASEKGTAGPFKRLSGGPTYCSSLVASVAGDIYLCEQSPNYRGGKVWRYSKGQGWSASTPPNEAIVISVDPRQSERAILIGVDGASMLSNDGCRSFEVADREWVGEGAEVAWTSSLAGLYTAEIIHQPREPGSLLVAQGVGVSRMAVSGRSLKLRDWSSGIENICATFALCVPGGGTFLTGWDKPIWRVDDFTSYRNDFRYPVKAGTEHSADLVVFGSNIDWAPEDPGFLVNVTAVSDRSGPGFSADGGRSWQMFAGTPSTGWGSGGCIAAGSRSNIVLLPSNNGVGVYSLDGGKSWSPIRLDGQVPTDGFANAFYVSRKNVTADKSRPGTFALVYSTVQNNGLGGIWVTRDGGQSWSQTLNGLVNASANDPRQAGSSGMDTRQFWQCQLDYVPGRPGELVYTPHADQPADPFFTSVDDGRSWSELHPLVRNVKAFGFGKSAPGQQRPAIYFWGAFKGKEGLYASLDWFADDPTLITRFPSDKLGKVTCISGDLDRFGRVIVGTSCAGWVRVQIGS